LPDNEKSRKRNGTRAFAPKSAPRVVVTYLDRTWTDQLAARRVELVTRGEALCLCIEVAARVPGKKGTRAEALRDFIAKRGRIDTIQIARRGLASLLRKRLRADEQGGLSVSLTADGFDCLYPTTVFFGPDAVTLNLG